MSMNISLINTLYRVLSLRFLSIIPSKVFFLMQVTSEKYPSSNDEHSSADYDVKHPFVSPGNHPPAHFKKHMSPLRFKCRQFLLQYTVNQSETIHGWQQKYATPFRDLYFAYTALLGSHMFYVVALPIPSWLGYNKVTLDLVYIIGYSIYLSGYLKDLLCLPRPQSPPCNRIALSKYTANEYGAPSSHCANATGVTLLIFQYLWNSHEELGLGLSLLIALFNLAYYWTLTLGRIYCGMHGLLDIIAGSVIGVFCFAVRFYTREYLNYDSLVQSAGWWYPVLSTVVGLALLLKHINPVDSCPCFEDSVAFVGVIAGIAFSDWAFPRIYNIAHNDYLSSNLSLRISIARTLVGILLVLLWKSLIAKRLLYTIPTLLMAHDEKPQPASGTRITEEVELYTPEPKSQIFCRFFVYFGIPVTVVIMCPCVFKLLNL
ncbi:sphinganine kinase LCB3 Ecym_5202 [Eremothecium cymbalariae DBVPG|uniref:Phosphatidic acid phosphatase type 2/haloperoxidase domain-containing protein n=1 Tax=Eremothecium cymbalariae (strain CBS 270.75 / DBVPG 7215 / KCTC 17166 / NRRL Y-17582) TaxID=931890 RepID=I6ND29_ERECY|nr:hypothetical protein Ecym_5202 [Eremothecium cymbalariae DBVPG\